MLDLPYVPLFIIEREIGFMQAEGAAKRIMAGKDQAEKSKLSRDECLRILGPDGFREVYGL